MRAEPNSSFQAASKAVWEYVPRQLAHISNPVLSQMNTSDNERSICTLPEIHGHD